jgi:hypothetical protein
MIISRLIILRMRNVSHKSCREGQNKHFMFNTFSPQNRAVHEKMWKIMVGPDRPQVTIQRKRCACWITKATDTQSEYVILIFFPRQKWERERALVLRYTYTACHVCSKNYTFTLRTHLHKAKHGGYFHTSLNHHGVQFYYSQPQIYSYGWVENEIFTKNTFTRSQQIVYLTG